MYLVSELSGKKQKAALENSGYQWVKAANAWMSRSGSIIEVQGADGALTDKKVAKLKAGAAGTAVVYIIMTTGHNSPKHALDALTKDVTVVGTIDYDDDKTIAFARVKNSSKAEMLVSATETSKGQQTILVFNETAIDQGLFASMVDVGAGVTIDDIWKVLDK